MLIITASGWTAYAVTLRLINQHNQDRERYKKTLSLIRTSSEETINNLREQLENSYAKGKQEGKRNTLDWIHKQVKDGSLEIKVVNPPANKSRLR